MFTFEFEISLKGFTNKNWCLIIGQLFFLLPNYRTVDFLIKPKHLEHKSSYFRKVRALADFLGLVWWNKSHSIMV